MLVKAFYFVLEIINREIFVKSLLCSFSYVLISFLLISNSVFGKNLSTDNVLNLNNVVDYPISQTLLNDVKLCHWKYGAKTCLNFSFDDNNLTHNKIARLVNSYGYPASFFVIASQMYTDSLKEILQWGNEVGSHTYSHLELPTLDSTQIEFEFSKSKEVIEKALGIHCVSVAEPGHLKTEQSTRLAFKRYLFIRNYSEYSSVTRARWALSLISTGAMTLANIMTELRGAMRTGNMFLLNGHGSDSEGYIPTSQEILIQTLDSVKKYSSTGDVWVTTIKDGGQYESLYQEVKLDKKLSGDTLSITFNNYLKDKYRDLDSSLISFEIPKTLSAKLISLSPIAKVKELATKYILTLDLKKDTVISLKLNLAPVANAGVNQVVDENTIVKLNGSNSYDLEGDSLTYLWSAPASLKLSSYTSPNPILKAPEVTKDVTYTLTLPVSDGISFNTSQVKLTIKQVNWAPTARVGNDLVVKEGSFVTLDGSSSSDPDGDKLTFTWKCLEDMDLNLSNTAHPFFIAPKVSSEKAFHFILTVSDGIATNTSRVMFVMVEHINVKPIAIINTMDFSIESGNSMLLNGSASIDPDGDALYYHWIVPKKLNIEDEYNASIQLKVPGEIKDTVYKVGLYVSDGRLNSDTTYIYVYATGVKTHFQLINNSSGNDAMLIKVLSVFVDGNSLNIGDEIGVFDGDLCVGVTKILDSNISDDIYTINAIASSDNSQGFNSGDEISFKIWDSQHSCEYSNVYINSFSKEFIHLRSSLYFVVNTVENVTLYATSKIFVSNSTIQKKIETTFSPNPFVDELSIQLNLVEPENIKIDLCDFDGRELFSLFDGNVIGNKCLNFNIKSKLKNALVPGIYLLKINDTIQKVIYKGH